MSDKKTNYKGYTQAQQNAHKKYMSNYAVVQFRLTPEKRDILKAHAQSMSESTTAFINRAIDETIERDKNKPE